MKDSKATCAQRIMMRGGNRRGAGGEKKVGKMEKITVERNKRFKTCRPQESVHAATLVLAKVKYID